MTTHTMRRYVPSLSSAHGELLNTTCIMDGLVKVGGIPTAEMNSLELEFLFMINFTLNVTPEVYR